MKPAKMALLSLLLSFALSAWGCADDRKKVDGSTATKNGEAAPLVTFVEIGSVRCIPCKMMQPIIKQIEEEYKGQVKVVFHDVWTPEGEPYGRQYKVRVIPTQVFLDNEGNEYFRHEGFFPKDDLVAVLKQKGVK